MKSVLDTSGRRLESGSSNPTVITARSFATKPRSTRISANSELAGRGGIGTYTSMPSSQLPAAYRGRSGQAHVSVFGRVPGYGRAITRHWMPQASLGCRVTAPSAPVAHTRIARRA